MGMSAGAMEFQLQFQISPIIMTGGLASSIIGGALPVLSLASKLAGGGLMTQESLGDSLWDAFAFYQPMAGGTLIDQQIGMYPFANQIVAANATIQQPLNISMVMFCPVGRGAGYQSKFALMQGIQAAFDAHNKSGGLYDIMTPAFVYTDVVMTAMTDISSTMSKQVQNAYKLDFIKPLVTLAAAQGAQNSLMSNISNGAPTDGSGTGATINTGDPTSAQAAPALGNQTGQGGTSIGGGSIGPVSAAGGSGGDVGGTAQMISPYSYNQ